MVGNVKDSPLHPIVNPNSIAFFGASHNSANMGTNQLLSILSLGFEGSVYPVHPKEERVQGLKAYRSVGELPETPDLAMVVLPTDVVRPTLEECGRKGIKHAIIVSGGFKEVGKEGQEKERELVRVARQFGIRFLGPNCMGVANPHHKLNTTILPHQGAPGFVGMASQSGSLVTQMFGYLDRFGAGFSTALSVGNEADVDLVDCLEYLGACPHTKVIALYVEGIPRGRKFVETAREIAIHKPIVALYTGGSETGRRAGLSHTGALAGPDQVYEGMFRQAGIVRAESITELFDFCLVLGRMPIPRGRGVVVQTHSGGPGAGAADLLGRAGLNLPTLSRDTINRLTPYIPHTGSVNNPVDLTFTKDPMDYFYAIPKVLLRDPGVDMLLLYFLSPEPIVIRTLQNMGVPMDMARYQTRLMIAEQCEHMGSVLKTNDKPIIGFSFNGLTEGFIRGLVTQGVPVFPGPDRAAKALGALVRYAGLRDKLRRSKNSRSHD